MHGRRFSFLLQTDGMDFLVLLSVFIPVLSVQKVNATEIDDQKDLPNLSFRHFHSCMTLVSSHPKHFL